MSAQPKALRLAEMFESFKKSSHALESGVPVHIAAAAALRRLHGANAELAAALEDVIGWIPGRAGFHTDEPSNARARARGALTKHRQGEEE